MSREPESIIAEIVRTLRTLRAAEDDREQRTAALRRLAVATVDLRAATLTPESAPDWTGRTWEYREAVRRAYRDAGLPADEARQIQNAVRWHVGEVLRERLSPGELAALGLRAPSPRERLQGRHDQHRAIIRAATSDPIADADAARALAGVLLVLRRMPRERLAGLDERERRLAAELLAEVERRAGELRRAAEAGAGE